MVSSRMSPRLTKFFVFAAVIGLVFWGYQVHLHETVKHLTEEVLSSQMIKLKEAFLSEHSKAESGELITGLRNLSIQLQQQQEEKQQQRQQQQELQDKQDELLRQQKEQQREKEEKEIQRQLNVQEERQQQQHEEQQQQKEEQEHQHQIELLNKQEGEKKKQQHQNIQQDQQQQQPKEQQRQLLQENDQQQNNPLQQDTQNQQHLQESLKDAQNAQEGREEDSKDEEGQQQQQEDKEQQQAGEKEEIQRERTSEEEFEKRRKRVTDVCSSPYRPPGRIHGVFTHKSGVLYCFVPKAGCTFWKRVFRATRSNDKATKETIFSISRNLVHSEGGKGVLYSPKLFSPQRYPTRLIVTRDPYSRLLSSYLDKVYLPDFWPTEIKPMARRHLMQNRGNKTTSAHPDFLRKHFNQMAAKFEPHSRYANSSTAFEINCGKYVTFADFVEEGYNRAEPHWMPIHQICNPCAFNVTHVSHMETFTEDARVILAQMGLEDVLDNVDDDAQIDEELKTIVDYNFYRAYHDHLQQFYVPCLSKRELAYRLWHNFRWRGYIDPDEEYAVPSFDDEERVKKDLFAQIWLARKSGLANRDRMKRAKKEFKSQAFASISKSVFEKLSDKYAYDFKLFGYDDVRDKLYSMYDKS